MMDELATVGVEITGKGAEKKRTQPRSLTAANVLQKKRGRTVKLQNPILRQLIGEAEAKGYWLIYGMEKNGKTWFTLQLAKDISLSEKVAYISAEEGVDDSFKQACLRANITASDKIVFDEYLSVDDIVEKFSKPKTPNIIIIDNLTMYADEIKSSRLKKDLLDRLPNKLIILIAHEDRKKPYPAVAQMARKLSKVIINVVGLRAFVVSRFSQGGHVDIEERNAELYWGEVGQAS